MASAFPSLSTAGRTALAALACVLTAGVAQAQAVADPAADLPALTQRWLDDAITRNQPAGLPLRMEVSIGALDSRLRLAPCARVEPYLPAGSRLWGRTRLGLRCTQGGGRWNVFLPVTVKAFGPAWVLRDNVVAGSVLTAADAVQTEADWAAEPSPVIAEAGAWVGQVASRSLMAGQPLRQSMVKAAQAFAAGTPVRVVAQGPGFEISSDAEAVTPGVVGQPVRVRMENGRIANGIVLDLRTVRLPL